MVGFFNDQGISIDVMFENSLNISLEKWEIYEEPKKPRRWRVKTILELLQSGWRTDFIGDLINKDSKRCFRIGSNKNEKISEQYCGKVFSEDDVEGQTSFDGDIWWSGKWWTKEMLIELED